MSKIVLLCFIFVLSPDFTLFFMRFPFLLPILECRGQSSQPPTTEIVSLSKNQVQSFLHGFVRQRYTINIFLQCLL